MRREKKCPQTGAGQRGDLHITCNGGACGRLQTGYALGCEQLGSLQQSAGEVKRNSNADLILSGLVTVSTPLAANVPCTPHQTPASLAASNSGHAMTIDHVHARTAGMTDLCDHAVRLMKWHECCCIRRGCDG